MNQEESKDDEKKINFIFNDSFIKITNGNFEFNYKES